MTKPSRLSPSDARAELRNAGAPLDVDFHALRSAVVESLVASGRRYGYKKSRFANGSYGRCWHAYLVRVARRN